MPAQWVWIGLWRLPRFIGDEEEGCGPLKGVHYQRTERQVRGVVWAVTQMQLGGRTKKPLTPSDYPRGYTRRVRLKVVEDSGSGPEGCVQSNRPGTIPLGNKVACGELPASTLTPDRLTLLPCPLLG